jgi:hypothetical protein
MLKPLDRRRARSPCLECEGYPKLDGFSAGHAECGCSSFHPPQVSTARSIANASAQSRSKRLHTRVRLELRNRVLLSAFTFLHVFIHCFGVSQHPGQNRVNITQLQSGELLEDFFSAVPLLPRVNYGRQRDSRSTNAHYTAQVLAERNRSRWLEDQRHEIIVLQQCQNYSYDDDGF